MLGAAAGQVVADLTGRRHMMWVLTGVTIMLAIAGVLATATQPMVLAMGALNSPLRRAGNIPISLTFVTGVLVRFGQGLGAFLAGRTTGLNWLVQAAPWFGLISGATLGTVAYGWIGEAAVWLPVVLAGLLTACSAAMPDTD